MSNPNDPNLEQQPATDGPAVPEAPAAPAAAEAPQYAPPAPMGAPVPEFAAPAAPPAPPAPPAAPAPYTQQAQQPYGQQTYAQQPQQQYSQQYAATKPTNTMAIISMISSIVGIFTFGILCLLGVILGHISLGQIKRKNEGGKGMAITGLIVGYVGIAGWIIAMILIFMSLAIFGAALSDPTFVSELESLS